MVGPVAASPAPRPAAVAASPAPRRVKRKTERPQIPGNPRLRSALEHEFCTGRMRAALAKIRANKKEAAAVQECAQIIAATKPGSARSVERVLRKKIPRRGPNRGSRFILGKFAKIVKSRFVRLTFDDELDCTFHRSLRDSDVARALHTSTTTVARTRMKVSFAWHELLKYHLRTWRRHCKRCPPSTALHARKYDSASFWLRSPVELPGIGELKPSQTGRPIHCMVQRRILVLSWPTRTVEMAIPIPTVPIASTSATCTHQSLSVVPQVQSRGIDHLHSANSHPSTCGVRWLRRRIPKLKVPGLEERTPACTRCFTVLSALRQP